jgi:hypothetical protein
VIKGGAIENYSCVVEPHLVRFEVLFKMNSFKAELV